MLKMLNAQTKHSGHRDHLLFAVPVVIVFSILNLVTSITEVYGRLLEVWKPNEDESRAPHHFKALVSLISCFRLIQPRRRWRCSKHPIGHAHVQGQLLRKKAALCPVVLQINPKNL